MNLTEDLSLLITDVKTYLEGKYDLAKLDLIEKLVLVSAALIVIITLLMLLMSFVLFLSFSLAYFLSNLFQSQAIGFMIVAGIYFVVALLIFLFKEFIIVQPVLRYMLKVFFKPRPKKQSNYDE